MEPKKPVWLSKTFWVNTIAAVAMLVQSYTGFVIEAEMQIAILAVINMILRMITKEAIVWSKGGNEKNTTTLKTLIWILPLTCAMAAGGIIHSGCGGMQATQGGAQTSWVEEINQWTPHQKANFFIDVWQAEHQSYKAQNAIEKKPADLIDFLQTKRKILEAARKPIRSYSEILATGAVPGSGLEQEIIALIRELQRRAWGGA